MEEESREISKRIREEKRGFRGVRGLREVQGGKIFGREIEKRRSERVGIKVYKFFEWKEGGRKRKERRGKKERIRGGREGFGRGKFLPIHNNYTIKFSIGERCWKEIEREKREEREEERKREGERGFKGEKGSTHTIVRVYKFVEEG